MHHTSRTEPAMNDCYWRGRAVDTQQQLAKARTRELRAVYSELLGHYERMGRLRSHYSCIRVER